MNLVPGRLSWRETGTRPTVGARRTTGIVVCRVPTETRTLVPGIHLGLGPSQPGAGRETSATNGPAQHIGEAGHLSAYHPHVPLLGGQVGPAASREAAETLTGSTF